MRLGQVSRKLNIGRDTIISFLQKKKLFYKIYIKTRHYYFELDSKKKIHNKTDSCKKVLK